MVLSLWCRWFEVCGKTRVLELSSIQILRKEPNSYLDTYTSIVKSNKLLVSLQYGSVYFRSLCLLLAFDVILGDRNVLNTFKCGLGYGMKWFMVVWGVSTDPSGRSFQSLTVWGKEATFINICITNGRLKCH